MKTTEDAFLLFKGNVVKDEDLDPQCARKDDEEVHGAFYLYAVADLDIRGTGSPYLFS